jgi:hypothetical protein
LKNQKLAKSRARATRIRFCLGRTQKGSAVDLLADPIGKGLPNKKGPRRYSGAGPI